MRNSTFVNPGVPNRFLARVSWALRILSAAAFMAAGIAKLAGASVMVESFEQIGIGQWFRVVTGLVEVIGAVAILVPATAAYAAIVLAITMFFAVLTHVFVIGGSSVAALALLLVTAAIAWIHRASFAKLFGQFKGKT
ncbi:MAG: DoxX family protein [Alcaligenaceae bacterium]|nr:DoxX family protein [Alcaligenaceae bacterium]